MIENHGLPNQTERPVPSSATGLSRDVSLLRCLANQDVRNGTGLSVTSLAAATKRDASQVSRAMRALELAELVERDEHSREYRLGRALFELASHAAQQYLYRLGIATLDTLAERVDENVFLCTLTGINVRTIATRSPATPLLHPAWCEGFVVPAHTSSAGRALLGDLTPTQIAQRFAMVDFDEVSSTSNVRSMEDLCRAVRTAAEVGYALVDEEFEPGLIGASAPVRDHTSRLVAAINVAAPKERWIDRLDDVGRAASAAASELSASLGYVRRREERSSRPV